METAVFILLVIPDPVTSRHSLFRTHRAPQGFELLLGPNPPQRVSASPAVHSQEAEGATPPALDSSADGAAPAEHTEPRLRPVDIDNAQLLATLRANAWNPARRVDPAHAGVGDWVGCLDIPLRRNTLMTSGYYHGKSDANCFLQAP